MRTLLLGLLLWNSLFAQFAAPQDGLQKSFREHIHYSNEGPNIIGHLYIGGHDQQITQSTFIYVKNALEYYRETLHPVFIILELDTPGGQVFPAQKISDALKEMDILYGIPVVAYINNWAISAGAMLAYSCRYIVTTKDGSMGAAQPITQKGEAASEKVSSAIRADFAGRAAFFDRNPLIAEAMVDADHVLVVRDDQVIQLVSNDEIAPSDWVITRKGKLLTLNAQEMVDLGVADLRLLPEKLLPITPKEKKTGEWPAKKELLFGYPFFEKIPHAVIKSYQMDWKTRFFTFLSHPIVSAILVFGFIIGLYLELSMGGFGIAGGIAVISLALLILSSFAIEAAGWLEYIILGAGLVLLILEIFVIPGFGMTAILGILLTAIGLGLIILPGLKDIHFDFDTRTLNAAGHYVVQRIAWIGLAIVIGIAVIALLAKYVTPKFALFSRLVLRGEQDAEKGYVAGLKKEELPQIGDEGKVLSPLRTAGKIEISGKIYDAVSSGSFIEKGHAVQVVDIEGSKIIVEEKRK